MKCKINIYSQVLQNLGKAAMTNTTIMKRKENKNQKKE